MANTYVLAGAVSDGAVLDAGDEQIVDNGGVANQTTINVSGLQTLAPGAVTHDVVVNLGGAQGVGYGGQTYDTVLNGGQQSLSYYIVAHGTPTFSIQGAEHTVINAGGVQNDGGRAYDTVINDGGIQNVYGYSTGTVINAGGTQNVDTGYLNSNGLSYPDLVVGTTVEAGGVQNIVSGSVTGTHLLPGGAITIQAINYADGGTASFDSASGALTVTDNGQTVSLSLAGDYSTTAFTLGSSGGKLTVSATALCFCRGTRIRTVWGDVAVEMLQVGDLVRTATERVAPIRFVGSAASLVNEENRPVIVRAGALGVGRPDRDLLVTRGHSFLFGDVLIPVGELVNGVGIAWSERTRSMEVFHVGLDRHDILLAEGAPAESYRNDGNGMGFTSSAGERSLPEAMPTYAPVVAKGPIVERTRARLAAIAETLAAPVAFRATNQSPIVRGNELVSISIS